MNLKIVCVSILNNDNFLSETKYHQFFGKQKVGKKRQ